MLLRVISAIVVLWAPLAGASEEVGQVMAATPKCALINAPSAFALVTGKLDVKQGDLVKGHFLFHNFVLLRGTDGRLAGVDVFVEETATTVAGLDAAKARIKSQC